MQRKSKTLSQLKNVNRNTQEQARAKINLLQIVTRLQQCSAGEIEMTREQLKASEILLSKALPNLTSNQQDVEINHTHSISPATLLLLQAFKSQQIEKLVNASVIDDSKLDYINDEMTQECTDDNNDENLLLHSTDSTSI